MTEVVECCYTLVEEVDGLHAGVLLIADLQLMELTKQIDQLLHHLHPILTETTQTHDSSINYRFHKETNDLTVWSIRTGKGDVVLDWIDPIFPI